MTINSDVRVAGPFTATGASQVLPFTFRIFNVNDVVVYVTNLSGVDTKLINQTGFTVAMNADQNASPGGTVTITSTLNFKLTLTTELPNTQPAQLSNGGGFYPTVINDMVDRVTVLVQQAVNAASRSFKIPVSDGTSVNTNVPGAAVRANKILAFDASGNIIPSNLTLAQLEAQPAGAAASAAAAAISAGNAATSEGNALTYQNNAQTYANQAQAAAAGFKFKTDARIATTAALASCTYANGASGVGATLTSTTNNAFPAVDGVTLALNERILVKDQAAPAQNGIYQLSTVGTGATPWVLTRVVDMDQWNEVNGATVTVDEGTANADTAWLCTSNQGGTMGTTAITWGPFPVFIPAGSITNAQLAGSITVSKFAAAAYASQVDAETGTENTLIMTALRVLQAIAKLGRTQHVAETNIAAAAPQVSITGLPANINRLRVNINGLRTNMSGITASSDVCIQIGSSGGIVTTGYSALVKHIGVGLRAAVTAGFAIITGNGSSAGAMDADTWRGWIDLTRIDIATNKWLATGQLMGVTSGQLMQFGGSVSLPGVLDRFRLTTIGNVDTMQATGQVSYEYDF